MCLIIRFCILCYILFGVWYYSTSDKTDEPVQINFCRWGGKKHLVNEMAKVNGSCTVLKCEKSFFRLYKQLEARHLLIPSRYVCAEMKAPDECFYVAEDPSLEAFPECCEMVVCAEDGNLQIWMSKENGTDSKPIEPTEPTELELDFNGDQNFPNATNKTIVALDRE